MLREARELRILGESKKYQLAISTFVSSRLGRLGVTVVTRTGESQPAETLEMLSATKLGGFYYCGDVYSIE